MCECIVVNTSVTYCPCFGQLYREAGYWRCESLKRAIEEQMHLYRSTLEVDTPGHTQRGMVAEVRCTPWP